MDIEDILEEKYNNDLKLTLEESKYVLEKDKHKHYVDSLLEKAYETVLSELEKKDRIIKEMAKHITSYSNIDVIEYFTNKVEREGK